MSLLGPASSGTGVGTFGTPAAASTTWTAPGSETTCQVTVKATSPSSLFDTKAATVAVAAATSGNVGVTVDYVPQPVIDHVWLQTTAAPVQQVCSIQRTDASATCPDALPPASSWTVAFTFAADAAHPASASLTDDCGGSAVPDPQLATSIAASAAFRWTAPAAAGVCILSAKVTAAGLMDTFPVEVVIAGESAPPRAPSWAKVAAGEYHTVAVKTDGTLWTWGWDGYGQLGDGDPSGTGTTTSVSQPAPVLIGSGFAAVSAGTNHTVAVKQDGTLWAWGDNYYGQLGDGTATTRYVPAQIGSGFAAVSAGWNHTVALKMDGTLWAWGNNYNGQLGDGTTTTRYVPAQIGSGFAAVSAGSYLHTVAVKADGTLWAWGFNSNGQLGDGTTAQRSSPVQIGSGFVSAAAGSYHTEAVKADGTLWAWGSNYHGQLGDGTWTSRYVPVYLGP